MESICFAKLAKANSLWNSALRACLRRYDRLVASSCLVREVGWVAVYGRCAVVTEMATYMGGVFREKIFLDDE